MSDLWDQEGLIIESIPMDWNGIRWTSFEFVGLEFKWTWADLIDFVGLERT